MMSSLNSIIFSSTHTTQTEIEIIFRVVVVIVESDTFNTSDETNPNMREIQSMQLILIIINNAV